ncbi:hypothetical protein [Sediminibacterium goheungense]|uniref:Uncharacterized protein n=1 Tax=Sediminibacterium goheungense TaxID=1086393 RepID=A0A4R6IV07_9BACT|nr:hypothetical protein [Sediminibacterium goheungense]TDO25705.1 hypothetical protein BC659_2628 [Sediminibacterium goheungense]
MKKNLFASVLSITILFAIHGCKTAAEKEEAAEIKVENAQTDLKDAKEATITDAQKEATDAEWKIYKNNAETTIANNEIRIAELRVKMTKSGKTMDAVYASKINAMQVQNKNLKARLDAYDKEKGNWASFKTEFGNDMDELGKAIAGFVTKKD